MATIEELEQQAAAIEAAEGAAIAAIADAIREQAVNLPEGSRLALRLGQAAKRLEVWRPQDAHNWGTGTIDGLVRDIDAQQREDWGDVAGEAS